MFSFQVSAFVVAALICISRIADNKHHPSDVVAGALLGAAVQAFNAVHVMKLFGKRGVGVGCGLVNALGETKTEKEEDDDDEKRPLARSYGSNQSV